MLMDSPEFAINAIHPLTVESENDGLILPTASSTPTDNLRLMDDVRGEVLEGQDSVEAVYFGLPEGGNLQVRFLIVTSDERPYYRSFAG